MATYNQLPVYKATYDLLLYVYQTGKDVQRATIAIRWAKR